MDNPVIANSTIPSFKTLTSCYLTDYINGSTTSKYYLCENGNNYNFNNNKNLVSNPTTNLVKLKNDNIFNNNKGVLTCSNHSGYNLTLAKNSLNTLASWCNTVHHTKSTAKKK